MWISWGFISFISFISFIPCFGVMKVVKVVKVVKTIKPWFLGIRTLRWPKAELTWNDRWGKCLGGRAQVSDSETGAFWDPSLKSFGIAMWTWFEHKCKTSAKHQQHMMDPMARHVLQSEMVFFLKQPCACYQTRKKDFQQRFHTEKGVSSMWFPWWGAGPSMFSFGLISFRLGRLPSPVVTSTGCVLWWTEARTARNHWNQRWKSP